MEQIHDVINNIGAVPTVKSQNVCWKKPQYIYKKHERAKVYCEQMMKAETVSVNIRIILLLILIIITININHYYFIIIYYNAHMDWN